MPPPPFFFLHPDFDSLDSQWSLYDSQNKPTSVYYLLSGLLWCVDMGEKGLPGFQDTKMEVCWKVAGLEQEGEAVLRSPLLSD